MLKTADDAPGVAATCSESFVEILFLCCTDREEVYVCQHACQLASCYATKLMCIKFLPHAHLIYTERAGNSLVMFCYVVLK